MSRPPRVLSIAGSDSSGGAGIQADIKTITMLGGYAMTAITAVTAQNSVGVQSVNVMEPGFVADQIASCISDIGVDAVKIGMLGSAAIADVVAETLDTVSGPIVFDPVMVATSGSALADDETIAAFERLMSIATLITPNVPELEVLTGHKVTDIDSLIAATRALTERTECAVLAKGGHLIEEQRVTDVLVQIEDRSATFDHPREDTRHTHGTGCTLSSAIATLLGHNVSIEHAVRLGRHFVFEAIRHAPEFGAGSGPLGHQDVRKLD